MLDIARRGTPAIRAVAGGLNYNPDDNPSHGDPAEMPEQSRPWQRALGTAVLNRIWEVSPWMSLVTVTTPATDAQRGGSLTAGGYLPGRQTWQLTGSTQVQAYWLTDDLTAPTFPDNPSLSTSDFTSHELVAMYVVSQEERLLAQTLARDGTEVVVPQGESGVDPFLCRELAESLARGLTTAVWNGADSNTDPLNGIGRRTFTATQTATNSVIADVTSALATLRDDGRFPNAIVWSPAVHKSVRLSTDASGRYIFPPYQPVVIDGIPAYPVRGIPEGASSWYLVGDMSRVVFVVRRLGNGQFVQIDRAPVEFSTDRWSYRAIMRVDVGLVPASGPASIIKIASDI
jgi:HK97 family phage major capsid protein